MVTTLKIPFYAKVCLLAIGMFAIICLLYEAQNIILPLIYSIIISIVLNPLVLFLVRNRVGRVLAIGISMTFACLVILSLVILLCYQLRMFTDTFPKVLDKFSEMLNTTGTWISDNFNVDQEKINSFIADLKTQFINSSKSALGPTLTAAGDTLLVLILIPVYVFMLLFYRPLLLEFIRKLFKKSSHGEVNEVLYSTKKIIQRYLLALLLEAVIVATLNSVGLLLIGIDYAILLGIIGAIVNVIPYLGGILGVAFPLIIALVTKSSSTYALLVILVYSVIQFIDNHYIIPKVVASKVRLNALISIIVVLIGGALWGIPGMFISIPMVAIFKVVCDHIESLKPVGFLLGDNIPFITIFNMNSKSNNNKIPNHETTYRNS